VTSSFYLLSEFGAVQASDEKVVERNEMSAPGLTSTKGEDGDEVEFAMGKQKWEVKSQKVVNDG
jgi:hypothetical protein